MPSAALANWSTARSDRLDEIVSAHEAVSGSSGPGRRRGTQQLNRSFTLHLAAEFQGFARELHDTCCDYFGANTSNSVVAGALNRYFTATRVLDTGNAHPGGLQKDFARFGIDLWAALGTHYPSAKPRWNRSLELLVRARNAIAHSNTEELVKIKQDGFDANVLGDFRACRNRIHRLAAGMDSVMADYLAVSLGTSRPW